MVACDDLGGVAVILSASARCGCRLSLCRFGRSGCRGAVSASARRGWKCGGACLGCRCCPCPLRNCVRLWCFASSRGLPAAASACAGWKDARPPRLPLILSGFGRCLCCRPDSVRLLLLLSLRVGCPDCLGRFRRGRSRCRCRPALLWLRSVPPLVLGASYIARGRCVALRALWRLLRGCCSDLAFSVACSADLVALPALRLRFRRSAGGVSLPLPALRCSASARGRRGRSCLLRRWQYAIIWRWLWQMQ